MAVSMDGEVRRTVENAVLEFFYKKLLQYKQLVHVQEFDVTYVQVEDSYRRSLQYTVLPMLMTVVTNPKEDVIPSEGDKEGILTKRLKLLIEDVFSN